jgi:hypothetical protein
MAKCAGEGMFSFRASFRARVDAKKNVSTLMKGRKERDEAKEQQRSSTNQKNPAVSNFYYFKTQIK